MVVPQHPSAVPRHPRSALCTIAIFVSLVLLTWYCTSIPAQSRSTDVQTEYDQVIAEKYPDYCLMSTEEIWSTAREFALERLGSATPTIAHADLDGNGLVDFAALIRSKSEEDRKTALVILLQMTPGSFEPAFNFTMAHYRTGAVIVPVERGRRLEHTGALDTNRDGPNEVTLKYPGVELIYVGKSAVVYFWDMQKKEFSSIWTAD